MLYHVVVIVIYLISLILANNKCRLDQTCCTSTAESSLITNVNNIYGERLYNKLNSTIRECLNQPLQSKWFVMYVSFG